MPTRVDVRARRDGPDLRLEISDDGRGGASTDGGTGLRGLEDRVAALGGTFRLTSPPDGGTRIVRGAAVRVVLAEDNVLLREGVARVLRDGGFEVVGAVGDAAALLDLVAREPARHRDRGHPHATDLHGRGAAGGGGAAGRVPADAGRRPVAGRRAGPRRAPPRRWSDRRRLSAQGPGRRRRRAARRGSAGGARRHGDRSRGRGRARRPRRDRDALVELTQRETTVLRLMAEGRSNGAIATALGVGEKTIETHVAHIFSKLGLEPQTDDHRRVLAVLTWLRVH